MPPSSGAARSDEECIASPSPDNAQTQEIHVPDGTIYRLLVATAGPDIPGYIRDPLRLLPGGRDTWLFARSRAAGSMPRLMVYFPR